MSPVFSPLSQPHRVFISRVVAVILDRPINRLVVPSCTVSMVKEQHLSPLELSQTSQVVNCACSVFLSIYLFWSVSVVKGNMIVMYTHVRGRSVLKLLNLKAGSRGPSPSFNRASPTVDQSIQVGSQQAIRRPGA